MSGKSKLLAILGLVGSLLIVLGMAWWSQWQRQPSSLAEQLLAVPDSSEVVLGIGEDDLRVTVVHSPESRTKGLGYQSELSNDGMVFVFEQKKDRYGFWMKGMEFDLDMIWITNGEIIEITPQVPMVSEGDELLTYHPRQPVDLVLELAAGRSQELGLEAGDELTLKEVIR